MCNQFIYICVSHMSIYLSIIRSHFICSFGNEKNIYLNMVMKSMYCGRQGWCRLLPLFISRHHSLVIKATQEHISETVYLKVLIKQKCKTLKWFREWYDYVSIDMEELMSAELFSGEQVPGRPHSAWLGSILMSLTFLINYSSSVPGDLILSIAANT